jgi:DNA-3-methyladenine glycosylase II
VPVTQTVFSIMPVPPFRLDLTAWALRRRLVNTIDHWDGTNYRRVLMIGIRPAEVTVRQTGSTERPTLLVSLSGAHLTPSAKTVAKSLLERMLGLRTNLTPFYALAARDRRIASLVHEFRGLKPPRFPTIFEAVVNGIACQQLSLLVGLLLLSRLTRQFGVAVPNEEESLRAFPDPVTLAGTGIQSLMSLGFSSHKAKALIQISSAIRDRHLDLEKLAALDNETALQSLLSLHGVGRWTAEYVLLRGLGRLDTFPGDDVGARNNLVRFLSFSKPLGYDGVRRAVAGWQPYAGFIYFHLLLLHIKEQRWLESVQEHN